MALEQALLDILVCPVDKGGLLYFADEKVLYNPRLRRRYQIRDDVPVMLANSAETLADEEHTRLLRRASDGEAVQTRSLRAGARMRRQRVGRRGELADLDVANAEAGGPGNADRHSLILTEDRDIHAVESCSHDELAARIAVGDGHLLARRRFAT